MSIFRTPALLLLAGCMVLQSSCAGRTVTTRRDADDRVTVSRSVEIHGSGDAARLDRGKQLLLQGDYSAAAEAFSSVYEKPSASEDHRREALFQLGLVYSELMNPKKDLRRAYGYFETLVRDYPKSDLVDEATRRMETIESLLERD